MHRGRFLALGFFIVSSALAVGCSAPADIPTITVKFASSVEIPLEYTLALEYGAGIGSCQMTGTTGVCPSHITLGEVTEDSLVMYLPLEKTIEWIDISMRVQAGAYAFGSSPVRDNRATVKIKRSEGEPF